MNSLYLIQSRTNRGNLQRIHNKNYLRHRLKLRQRLEIWGIFFFKNTTHCINIKTNPSDVQNKIILLKSQIWALNINYYLNYFNLEKEKLKIYKSYSFSQFSTLFLIKLYRKCSNQFQMNSLYLIQSRIKQREFLANTK